MSVERYDPNTSKVIPPDVYRRNAGQIERIKAIVDNFETLNEAGRRNFEIMEQEEYELQKKIQEGAQALERLKALRSQKSTIETSNPRLVAEDPAYTSRGNEVGTNDASRFVYLPESQTGYQHNSSRSAIAQNVQQPVQTQFIQFQPNHANPNGHIAPPPTQQQFVPYNHTYPQSMSQPAGQQTFAPQQYAPLSPPRPQGQVLQRTQKTYYREQVNTASQVPRGTNTNNNSINYNYHRGPQTDASPQPNSVHVPHTPTLLQPRPPSGQPAVQSVPINVRRPPASSSGISSLAFNRNSINPPSVPHLSNSHQAIGNTASPKIHVTPPISSSSNALQAVSSRDSSTPHHSFSSNSSRSSVTQPGQGPLLTPGHPPLPIFHLPHNPTEQQILAARNHLIKWGNDTAAPAYANSYFNFFGWRVKCFKDQDGDIQVRLENLTKNVVMHLDLFIDQVLKNMTTMPGVAPPPPLAVSSVESRASHSQKTPLSGPNSSNPKLPNPIPPSRNVTDQTPVKSRPVIIHVPTSVPLLTTPGKRPSLATINGNSSLPSPREANRKTLARDIMFGLGKRLRESVSSTGNLAQPAKRQTTEASLQRQSGPNALQLEQPGHGVQLLPVPQMSVPETSSSASISSVPELPNGTGSTTNIHLPTTSDKPTLIAKNSAQEAPQELPTGHETSGNAKAELEPKPNGLPLPVPTTQSMPSVMSKTVPNHASTFRVDPPTARMKLPSPPEMKDSTVTPSATVQKSISSVSSQSSKEATLAPAVSTQKHGTLPVTPATAPVVSQTQAPVAMSIAPPKASSPARSMQGVIDLTSPLRPAPTVSSSASSSKNNEPLCLPSSSHEPNLVAGSLRSPEESTTSDEVGRVSLISGVSGSNNVPASKKRKIPYVLVPPAPEYLVRHRQQMKRREKEASGSGVTRGSRTDSVSTSVVGEEDFFNAFETQRHSPQDEDEREAVQLACSRLQVLRCRWDGCGCKLNSVDALIRHLNQHKPALTLPKKSFMCRWTQCGQQGINFNDKHLEKHASLPLRCAYLGCSDTFRSGAQLLKHFRSKHKDGTLKPSAKPSIPTLQPLQPIPGSVPSYTLVTSLIGRESISKERHESLGRWVARDITSSDQMPKRIKKAARSSNHDTSLPAQTGDDYEFLTTRSTRYSSYISDPVDIDLSDLDSANISIMVHNGLTLWGSDGGKTDDDEDESPPGSPPLTPTRSIATHGEIKLEADDEPSNDSSERHHDDHSSDEEDAAVEIMLTDMTPTS